ncbi:MAG: glycosyltransferase, partial [Gammaproteobacteria bacterium]
PAAVISAIGHANVVSIWGRRMAGVRTRAVVTVHTTITSDIRNEPTWKGRACAWAEPLALRRADAVIAVSQGVADDLIGKLDVPGSLVRVIPNPAITPELLESSAIRPDHPWLTAGGPPLVVAVGRLNYAKDFATLLRAFAVVRSTRPARLLILGEGEERAALEALVRTLGVARDVQMPGFVEHPAAYVRHAQLFVLSSVIEGLPTVLIEALAVGANIVSTDCESGPREILDGGRLGRLVPPRDPSALASAMLEAFESPSPRASVAAIARYSRDTVIEEYLRVLLALVPDLGQASVLPPVMDPS